MYTGIIDHCGTIIAIAPRAASLQITIQCNFMDLIEGESIAIDGFCVTAIAPQPKQFAADISPETLRLTTAGRFVIGRQVNLERSLRLGDRMGGHWVMGHVDGRGRVLHKEQQQEFTLINFGGLESTALQYILKKGSIAINGVSLTINEVFADGFQVMLIPHTLARTTLKDLQENDEVNLEYDWMTRVIVNQLKELPLIKQLA